MATVRGNGCRCVQTHCFPFGNVLYIDLSYPGKWAVNVLGGAAAPGRRPKGGRQNPVKEFLKIYIRRNFKNSERIN